MHRLPGQANELTRDRSALQHILVFGALTAFCLIAYGWHLIPTASALSFVPASVVFAGYAAVGWRGTQWLGLHDPVVRSASLAFGMSASLVFVVEILLEYLLLPANNSAMGLVEFGLVFALYTAAAAWATQQRGSLRAGVKTAVATAMLSSLIWFITVLIVFYAFLGTGREQSVFRAEGVYDDFARSGMADFDAFVMEDFLGAGFFHLLLGPLLAGVLGIFGGIMGLGLHRLTHRPRRVP